MNLTFTDDWSSDIVLDTELTGVPESGIYFNHGVHPLITIDNILTFLSDKTITYSAYVAGTTYGKYLTTRAKSDIVTSGTKIYQSKVASNIGHDPSTSPTYWLETNLSSLKIKAEIFKAEDALISSLKLNRKLVENQYIYNLGKTVTVLEGDFSGWAFEPKGSDYVKIRINQMSLQANTTTPVSVYVINQGVLITTLTLNPNNGILAFEDVNYTISGKGIFYFVFASQSVLSNNCYNDPLKYTGFVCYPVQGIGATAATATYKESVCNGLNFNVTAYVDSTVYVTNNMIDFSKALQSQFELNMLRLFLNNPMNRVSSEERNVLSKDEKSMLYNETVNKEGDTVISRYIKNIDDAKDAINRSFDKFTKSETQFKIKLSTV